MKRYIDADALKPDYIRPSLSNSTVYTYYVSLYQIQNTPTADVVEVVRCKDCHWRHDDSSPMWLPCMERMTDDDWFCGDGVRREDDQKRS